MLLAAGTHAQTWETLLPDPLYRAGDLTGRSAGGGRSLVVEQNSSVESATRVLLGMVAYDDGATMLRLEPDAPFFPVEPSPALVDSEPLGGNAWFPHMIRIPENGIWSVGRYTFRQNNNTAYYWRVRVSQTGDAGSWQTVDDYIPRVVKGSLGEANPHGIAASPTHVFVSGMDYNGSTWRWVVRRKPLASAEPFRTVLEVPTAGRVRARVCYYPGNNVYPAAVLTIGKTANVRTGRKYSASLWAIRRSLDGGATFPEEHTWQPVTSGFQAIPEEIAYDPHTGYIYAIGGLSEPLSTTLPEGGWVIRVNRHGGDPSKWETLIETTSGSGTAQRMAFGPDGTTYVCGNFESSAGAPFMAVLSNSPGQGWGESWIGATYPFGSAVSNRSAGDLTVGADGRLYITGDVRDYVDEYGESFPGTWIALSRLTIP